MPFKWFKVSFGVLVFTILPHLLKSNPQSHPLLGTQNEIILPFDYYQGFIIVDIIFHKKIPLKFILDTGAENSVLLKATKRVDSEVFLTNYHID